MKKNKDRSRLYVIGYPVSHSVSPEIFQEAFRAAEMEVEYRALPVSPGDLSHEVAGLVAEGALGFNVTVPHKRAIMPLLDSVDHVASEVGAVNVVAVDEKTARGYNTDIFGFESSFDYLGVPDISGGSALLLGSGGAARAVAISLARMGAGRIIIANRTPGKAAELARTLEGLYPETELLAVDIRSELLKSSVGDLAICVQATSLGLSGDDPLPLDPSTLPGGCFVYDLVYGKDETAFVRKARDSGLVSVDGREMLIRQAAGAFEIWFGMSGPLEAMRKGLERALGCGNLLTR